MARRIVIVQGHPDGGRPHLCHALADAYAKAAVSAGHEVRRIEVAKLRVDFLRTDEEFNSGEIAEPLREAAAALEWSEHILIVFPLWLGGVPALLKAFLEQVCKPGHAFAYVEHGLPRKLWTGKSARIAVTMGMPALAYRWWFGAHGLRSLESSILKFVGVSPIRESLFGSIGAADEARRGKWIEDMRHHGARAD